MKPTFLVLAVTVCFLFETHAQIIRVPADQGTIQAGINQASDGDTVLVAEGTYFENINFLGKAITVASQFIQDGDTSHISRTIIDGSQSVYPDTASVVTLWSGEDTTSVLMGFKITGGTGTNYLLNDGVQTERGGGGIFIRGSGGKISHNIIEVNHVEKEGGPETLYGGGINVWLYDLHTVVLRENIIRNNSVKGKHVGGGGIAVYGGRVVCEHNEILNNSAIAQGWVYGGGMMGSYPDEDGMIREVIVRNNIISGNLASTAIGGAGGGGYMHFHGYGEEHTRVYNNVITQNHASYIGGGLFFWNDSRGMIFNNTVVDNSAGDNGNGVVVVTSMELSFYHNIIWSDRNSKIPEFALYDTDASKLKVFNNILKQAFKAGDGVTAIDNWFNEPAFQPGTFELAENSPGIGWADDSILMGSAWYYAPSMDLAGNPRPHPVDAYIDLGAYESAFERTDPASVADLSNILLWDRNLEPSFHRDTLHYLMRVPDTVSVVPDLGPIPVFQEASVDMDPATDLRSPDPSNRTTTITVTAQDGVSQKIYTVEFYLNSTDASLSELKVDKGILNPEFEPEIYTYKVTLPSGSTETPGVHFRTSGSNAEVDSASAIDVTSTRKDLRTTHVRIIPEEGVNFQRDYYIEFNVDKNPPKIKWVSDSVNIDDFIKAVSSQSGRLFLVPKNTQPKMDAILADSIISRAAVINDTVLIPSTGLDPGVYWLYAANQYESVSKEATVKLSVVGIPQTVPSTVSLYPNPVKDWLYFEADDPSASVELFNSIGVLVGKVHTEEGRIDMSELKRGVYFIKIRTSKEEVYSGKVIKN